MSQNEFTKENKNTGLAGQIILDAGLNVFALELLVESFTNLTGKGSKSVNFTYKGVDIKLEINKHAT